MTSDAEQVVVGLGANLGRPALQLAEAARALSGLSAGPVRVAGLYRSAPVGPEQPDFINSALALAWPGDLEELLGEALALEARFGRQRNVPWGPRVLDLDLLWAGRRLVKTSQLRVPHPELRRRAFALRPLLDLFPAARCPASGLAYAELLKGVRHQRIERLAGPEWVEETLQT